MARSLMPSLFGETPAGRLPDPFGTLQREFNRLFQDAFAGFALPLAGGETTLSPRINICETDQDFRIDAELPGVPEESVDVTLSEDILTIRGEKKAERSEKQENYHLMERSYGSFIRSIRLPFAVKPEDVQASMHDGVLTLTLPKAAAQQQLHRIQISRGAAAGQVASAQGSQAKH